MIFEKILSWFFGFTDWVMDLIPKTNIFGSVVPDPAPFQNVLSGISCIMPVATVVSALGCWLVLANLDFVSGIVNWVIKKIPGVQ